MKKSAGTKQRWTAGILACMIGLLACLPAHAVEEEKGRTVKIAFPQQNGFSERNKAGDYSGYTYEYINKIAQYNHWNCEFITLDDMGTDEAIVKAMEMVQTGEADLIGGLLKSEALEKIYDFSDMSYGVVYTTLSTMESNAVIRESTFRTLDPLRVAVYEKAATRNGETADYLDSQSASYTFVNCKSPQEQLKKLKNGEVDAVTGVSLSYFQGTKTIAQYAPRPYYFAATKGKTELLAEVDEAIRDINYAFPYFEQDLQDKYFCAELGAFTLNPEQKAVFEAKKELNVLCIPDAAPYVLLNEEDNSVCGILPSLLEDFAKATGVTIRYQWFSYDKSFLETLNSGKYDIVLGSPVNDQYNAPMGLITSQKIAETEVVSFQKGDLQKKISDCKVALIRGSELAETIDAKEFVFYNTISECIRAVDKGKADIGFGNRDIVNYYLYHLVVNLTTTTYVGYSNDVCITLSGKIDNKIVTALNYYIRSIPDEQLVSYYTKINQMDSKDDLKSFLRKNPNLVMLTACLIFVFLFSTVSLIVYSKKQKKQYAEVKKANSAKTEFLSRMSHDMRTPMNAILSFSRMAREENHNGAINQYLDDIHSSGEYLLSLINDVLDLQKMEQQISLHPENIHMDQLFRDIFDMVTPMIREKNIEFIFSNDVNGFSMPRTTCVDVLRMKQIFVNVLTNAVKFTPQNGRIEFIAKVLSYENELAVIEYTVADNGVGMSEDFQTRMFEPFSQEDGSNTNNQKGTGLGLAIVKRIVDAMDGSVVCHSKLGEGTAMVVTLKTKLTDASDEKKSRKKCDAAVLRGKRILLCEDHPMNAKIACKLLEKKAMTVETAENGQKGLELFRASAPGYYDAILMDIRMPELDGLETTRAIRALARKDAAEIPIIAMSANALAEDVEKSAEAGMNAHLSKPIEPEKLYEKLSEFIGERES